MQKTILFIPHWVQRTLSNHKQPLSVLLDINALSEFLTSEDLAGILYLNKNAKTLFNFEDNILGAEIWPIDSIEHITPLIPLVSGNLITRLFPNPTSDSLEPSDLFQITDIDHDTIVVSLQPGMTAGKSHVLIKELLKLFYAYSGFDDMARRQIFKTYLYAL